MLEVKRIKHVTDRAASRVVMDRYRMHNSMSSYNWLRNASDHENNICIVVQRVEWPEGATYSLVRRELYHRYDLG